MSVITTATYSPEDNKLRLYAAERLNDELFARVKDAGFKWAPKQLLFVCPRWTPKAADLCAELAGEIEPELMTLAERAEIKAERLAGIQSNRVRDAGVFAQAAITAGDALGHQPILCGHRSQRKAEKLADRAERMQEKAEEAADASQYWGWRIRGVESHAKAMTSTRVRASRVKTLLKDLRTFQRSQAHAVATLAHWQAAANLCDKDARYKMAWNLCNIGGSDSMSRSGDWSALEDNKIDVDVLISELIPLWEKSAASQHRRRWIEHTLNRLDYENYELGKTAEFTGEITKSILQIFAREQGAIKPVATLIEGEQWEIKSGDVLPFHFCDGHSLEKSADEWVKFMAEVGHTVNTTPKRKSTKPKGAPLMHPSEEQAQKLLNMWNNKAREKHSWLADGRKDVRTKPTPVKQSVYSEFSKGDYAQAYTIELDANGNEVTTVMRAYKHVKTGVPVCRIRVERNTRADTYAPAAPVLIVGAKPKALPINWETLGESDTASQEDAA